MFELFLQFDGGVGVCSVCTRFIYLPVFELTRHVRFFLSISVKVSDVGDRRLKAFAEMVWPELSIAPSSASSSSLLSKREQDSALTALTTLTRITLIR